MQNIINKINNITGHIFKDTSLIRMALTHSSNKNAINNNYERLEFLGDRVLGLILSEIIFFRFPNAKEGDLALRLNALVNTSVCAQISQEIGLQYMIKMGEDMKTLETNRLIGMYADVIESLIAIIYIDGGLNVVRPFIERYWSKYIQKTMYQRRDAKTELQEWSYKKNKEKPLYTIIKRTGPDHNPLFEVEVKIIGISSAVGFGKSKQNAERSAAELFLINEGIWNKK